MTDKMPDSRENLAKLVFRLVDGQRDPELIRAPGGTGVRIWH